jgi:hypothetical protein
MICSARLFVSSALALLVWTGTTHAQERWVQTFSGADHVTSIAATGDGMFIVGNQQTHDSGIFDVWAARLADNGTALWERVLETSDWDQAESVVATPDGGCILAGFTRAFGAGALDGWVVKFASDGSTEWERTYGDVEDNQFVAIALSPDGYYVGGVTGPADPDEDAWVLELDHQGDVLWQRRIGGDWDDHMRSLVATPDGGVIFTANSRSAFPGPEAADPGPAVPFFRPWVVKLNGDGVSQWQRTYNYSGGDDWSQIVPLADGYLMVGEVLAAGFHRGDAWIVRLDTFGNVVWDRRYGDHFASFYDGAHAARQTADGGFVVLASTGTAGAGSQSWWLMKLDSNGLIQWDTTYGLPSYDGARALELTPSGDLLAGGFLGDEAVLMRLAPDGQTSCDLTSPTSPNSSDDFLLVEVVDQLAQNTSVSPVSSSAAAASQASGDYLCPPASQSFCDAGDGSLASCPCSNPGLPTTGCDLAQGTGGVELTLLEQELNPLNRATLVGQGFPVASLPAAVVIRAPQIEVTPVVFGDGLRCIAIPLVRLGAASASGGTSTHTIGHGAMAGSGTVYYQLWFRNTPAMFCSPDAFNLSNGRTLTW